jgi:hypothetical protein
MNNTGKMYEEIIENALLNNSDFLFERQVFIGIKPNNKTRHCVDILLKEREEVISLKYQGVAGTAEEKIPYEVLVLQHLINNGRCKSATIVLAGNAWTQRDWYLEDNFCSSMNCPDIRIINHDVFIKEYTNMDVKKDKGLEKFFGH